MKKCTLQVRITVIVGLILVTACLLLTANSLFAAHTYYGGLAEIIQSGDAMVDPARQEEIEIDPTLIQPSDFYQEASQKFSLQTVWSMVLIVGLALGATYWGTGRMLRPLKELTQSVRAVDDEHLNQRMSLEKAQGEVLTLSDAFNRMLERLEEAFLMQKRFAANAAHELKTPLTVIKSSLQVLEINPKPETEDYQEFMQNTSLSLDRIITTVEGLLALANLNTVPTSGEVELRPLLEQAAQELAGKAVDSQVSLSLSGEMPVLIHGNFSLLYRAFYNLIENAIKYNRPGGTVDVSMEQQEDAVCVRVEDSGIGMEKETICHIFEPFYRADPSRSQKIPGSGLGLAVVQMILERHGGEIRVESKAGAGSVFTVKLPNQEVPSSN